jgi:pimeloyl-ACP methyl ester carboxylesterase
MPKSSPAFDRMVNVPLGGSSLPTEVLQTGDGFPILLLHGLGDSALTWQWVIGPLAGRHRVYALSFPGFGGSAKPAAPYSPEFFVSFTGAFMDVMGIDRVLLVGSSLGGLVALRLAQEMPGRVKALALVGSAGLGREVSFSLRLLTLPGFGGLVTLWNKTFIGAYQWAMLTTLLLYAAPMMAPHAWVSGLRQMARMPGYLDATVATMRSIGNILGQKKKHILLDRLYQIEIPTLVLWGKQDRVIPHHHGQAAISRLPVGKLDVYEGCGHLPHIEAREQFVRSMSSFMQWVGV